MLEKHIGIIVLAAGASVRMGTPKQLLQIGGAALIRRAAQAALDSEGHPVVVVLGANAELIRPELEGLEVKVVVNAQWSAGMSSSIRCGVKMLLTLAPEIEGVVLMLADQPEVTGDALRKVLRAQTDSGLVAARYHGVLGTPALFARAHFDELLQLDGKSGARSLIERHRDRVRAVDLPEAARDLDTPEDLAAYEKDGSISTLFLNPELPTPSPREERVGRGLGRGAGWQIGKPSSLRPSPPSEGGEGASPEQGRGASEKGNFTTSWKPHGGAQRDAGRKAFSL